MKAQHILNTLATKSSDLLGCEQVNSVTPEAVKLLFLKVESVNLNLNSLEEKFHNEGSISFKEISTSIFDSWNSQGRLSPAIEEELKNIGIKAIDSDVVQILPIENLLNGFNTISADCSPEKLELLSFKMCDYCSIMQSADVFLWVS